MKSHLYFELLIISLCFSLFACKTYNGRQEFDISDGWKIQKSDSMSFAKSDFDDSSWETYIPKKKISLENSHYFWMRKTISIPRELQVDEVWLGLNKINCAEEIFINGNFMGERGSMPPDYNVRTEIMKMIHIPVDSIKDGKVTVAVRSWCPQNCATAIDFTIGNTKQAEYVNEFRFIFNQSIFTIMAMLCLFICFYAFAQYFSDRKISSFLFYALSLLFISIYFYDIGSKILILPYNLQRALTRSALPISISFIALFLNRFFDRKNFKPLCIGVVLFDVISFILFLLVYGNANATDNIFLVFLVPIFGVIVYGIVVTVKGIKAKAKDSLPLFIGFIIGSGLGVHDIICQAIGYVPFVWLQGFSFFFLNVSIFITISSRTARTEIQMEEFAKETEAQRNKLSNLFENAKQLTSETAGIVSALDSSVATVVQAASNSSEKVSLINGAIAKQKLIRTETTAAFNSFSKALDEMSKELESEANTIENTASHTSSVIQGMETVGNGITNAAKFSSTLSELIKSGNKDMRSLSDAMNKVEASSKEILSVANALDEFAQQTDLLAMNASIEAAHSGEAGKGFAVIAHEIKTLASASAQRSSKIGEIVQSINESIMKSVDLSQKVNKTLFEIQSGAVENAEKISSAADEMKTQQEAGVQIKMESAELSKNAKHLKEEAASQSKISISVMNNLEDLSKASDAVDSANAEISSSSKELVTQAKSLTSLAERTKNASIELSNLMN